MATAELLQFLPNLSQAGFSATSPRTRQYNCIAWAAGRSDVFMRPDPMRQLFRPPDVARAETRDAFVDLFLRLGYVRADSPRLEDGVEKIAIFELDGVPTHATRQLPDGTWTSKCGRLEDITHELEGVCGDVYGGVAVIMARTRPQHV
jgi:hypothetical protein